MRRSKKKRPKKLKLWIELGILALLLGCGAIFSQHKGFIHSVWRFLHFETAFYEKPAPKCDLLIPDHAAVDTWVKRFSEQQHGSFQKQLDRGRFHAAPAQQIFMFKGLPKDLVYVALVESGFSPTARSHAGAVGMWQIVPKTGSRFGLAQNQWVDERRHPMKAAKAAANYLSLLYNQFGSWSLALAAYNAGENAVQGALDKSGLKTFWDLREHGYLPAETRDYVPKVFAAVKIIRNPERYGFHMGSKHFVARQDTVSVPGGLQFSWVGKQIGVPEDILRSNNPELYRSVTPPGYSRYELRLPAGTGDELLAALARKPRHEEKTSGKAAAARKSPALSSYKVKSGDTLSGIAKRQNCSVTALAALNGMKPSEPLKSGRALKLLCKASSPSLSKVRAEAGKESGSISGSHPKKTAVSKSRES